MKILCAWCRAPLGFTCTQCGAPLIDDPDKPGWMLCTAGPSRIRYTRSAIARIVETLGICDSCADKLTALRDAAQLTASLTDEDRANLAQQGEI